MSGRFTTIGIEEIITSAKMQLRLQNTSEYDDYLDMKIREGARHLCALSIFQKRQCSLEINDGKAKLPKGFFRLLGARFKNLTVTVDDITTIQTGCSRILYVDKAFMNDCNCNTTDTATILDYSQGFQIVGDIIHVGSAITAEAIEVAYLSFNTDDSGNIIFYEDYERALSNYACYQYCLSFSENFNQYVVNEYKQTWISQKNWIKGSDVANAAQQDKRGIQAVFNALVLSPIVNW